MNEIGFSTGALYSGKKDSWARKAPLSQKLEIIYYTQASALEIDFYDHKKLINTDLPPQLLPLINAFEYISVHAPFAPGIRWRNDGDTERMLARLNWLNKRIGLDAIVIHASSVDNLDILKESGLPIVLENGDGRQATGWNPEFFDDMKRKYDFGFVLDTQHAYEHDPEGHLAQELLDAMGENLAHMHVSGYTGDEMHAPVHISENAEAIVNILGLSPDVPWICEGIAEGDIKNILGNEFEFLKQCRKR